MRRAKSAIAMAVLVLPCCLSSALADDNDRHMTVINRTSSTIEEFYSTSSRVGGWGRDLLADDTIDKGESQKFDLDDGTGSCVFDLKAVLGTGREVIALKVNICTASRWFVR